MLDTALLDELDIGLGIRGVNQSPGDVSLLFLKENRCVPEPEWYNHSVVLACDRIEFGKGYLQDGLQLESSQKVQVLRVREAAAVNIACDHCAEVRRRDERLQAVRPWTSDVLSGGDGCRDSCF